MAFGFFDFLIYLLIAAVCGSVAGAIVGTSRAGCLVSIALGLIGAMLGSWMSRELGLPEPFVVNVGGNPFPVVWSIVGATVFVAVISLVAPRRRRPL